MGVFAKSEGLASGVGSGSHRTSREKSVYCSLAVSSCHFSPQPRQSFLLCWWALGGVRALEVLLMMPQLRLRLLSLGGRAGGGRGSTEAASF